MYVILLIEICHVFLETYFSPWKIEYCILLARECITLCVQSSPSAFPALRPSNKNKFMYFITLVLFIPLTRCC